MVGVLLLAAASKADGASRVVAGEGAVETPRWRLAREKLKVPQKRRQQNAERREGVEEEEDEEEGGLHIVQCSRQQNGCLRCLRCSSGGDSGDWRQCWCGVGVGDSGGGGPAEVVAVVL